MNKRVIKINWNPLSMDSTIQSTVVHYSLGNLHGANSTQQRFKYHIIENLA